MRFVDRPPSGGGRSGGDSRRVGEHRKRHCPPFNVDSILKDRNGGRGGIRTHGGLPHARFRVECLKPDSATLPFRNKKTSKPACAKKLRRGKRRTSNIQSAFASCY